MNRTVLIIISAMLLSCHGIAQHIPIADTAFLRVLIEQGVDANNDGIIQLSEALEVRMLDVSKSDISDIQGLEAFANLEELDYSNNNLQKLPIGGLVQLQSLNCRNNKLEELDVSGNLKLNYLDCSENPTLKVIHVHKKHRRFIKNKSLKKSIEILLTGKHRRYKYSHWAKDNEARWVYSA